MRACVRACVRACARACVSTARTADVTVTKIAGYVRVRPHSHESVIFFVFLAFIVFTYGHFVEYMNMHAMS